MNSMLHSLSASGPGTPHSTWPSGDAVEPQTQDSNEPAPRPCTVIPRSPKMTEVTLLFPNLLQEEVYHLWVHLDLLPTFMRGLIDGQMPEIFARPWCFKIQDQIVRREAWTTERIPGERISWRSVTGAPYPNHGCVTFAPSGSKSTRVTVVVAFDEGTPTVSERMLRGIKRALCDTLTALRILARPPAGSPLPAANPPW